MSTQLLSAGAYRIYQDARDLLRRHFLKTNREPGPEHVLLAFIANDHELFRALNKSIPFDQVKLERSVFEFTVKMGEAELERTLEDFGAEVSRSANARQRRLADEWDLFVGVFEGRSSAISAALSAIDLGIEQVVAFLRKPEMQAFALRYEHGSVARPKLAGKRSHDSVAVGILDEFGQNLNEAARRRQLGSVMFRDSEIGETLETLCRQTQNNPILVGEPGVGKTMIVNGVAQAIADGKCERLKDHTIYRLSLGSLLATALDRKEWQQRISSLVAECQGRAVILFVDDFASVFPESQPGQVEDRSAVLRQALVNGTIQCIGECTPPIARKYLSVDARLMEVCHFVEVRELSKEQTVELLAELTPQIEAFHEVNISRDALITTVELTEAFLPESRLPGKATSLIDAVAARASLRAGAQKEVRQEDVAHVMARLTGLESTQLLSLHVQDFSGVETVLRKRIKGQDEAIRKVVDVVQVGRSGLSLKPQRPDGVFLLAGPTGVGKTELARALAEALHGSSGKLIRFDMSEFMEKHAVAKLIGSPPGYIGHDQEAQLTKKVRGNPRGVILFDEIEKAHPDLQNLFLQIFDAGRLTDAHGQTADFSQTIIIMTSNLGSREPDAKVISWNPDTAVGQQRRDNYETAIRHHFSPEFLNRLDAIIYMNSLSPEIVTQIAESQLADVLEQLQKRGKYVVITVTAFDLVVAQGYSAEFGARYLTRAIEQLVLTPLAKYLLENPTAMKLRIDAIGGKIALENLE